MRDAVRVGERSVPRTPTAAEPREHRPPLAAEFFGIADAAGRERLAATVQRSAGNRALTRMLAVQRWAIPAAADASCSDMIASANTSSPYAPEWAKTAINFQQQYGYTVAGKTARIVNGVVTHTAPVDMPEWSSSDPAMQTAWTTARTALRGHETQHQNKAATWQTTLQSRLNALSVTFDDPGEIAGLVTAEWDTWVADHQADQDSIDPYTVNINCPTPPAAAPGEGEGGAEGGEGGEGEATEESFSVE